jgi:hypothetical protein
LFAGPRVTVESEALFGVEARAAASRTVGGGRPLATSTRPALVLGVEQVSRHQKGWWRDAFGLKRCVELADRPAKLQHLAGFDKHFVRSHGRTLSG